MQTNIISVNLNDFPVEIWNNGEKLEVARSRVLMVDKLNVF